MLNGRTFSHSVTIRSRAVQVFQPEDKIEEHRSYWRLTSGCLIVYLLMLFELHTFSSNASEDDSGWRTEKCVRKWLCHCKVTFPEFVWSHWGKSSKVSFKSDGIQADSCQQDILVNYKFDMGKLNFRKFNIAVFWTSYII